MKCTNPLSLWSSALAIPIPPITLQKEEFAIRRDRKDEGWIRKREFWLEIVKRTARMSENRLDSIS
jgi:hypothetical protein